jgi:outer membrane protein assembly factor BamB
MPSMLRGKRLLPWLALGGTAIVLAAAALWVLSDRQGDVTNSAVEFVPAPESTPDPPAEPRASAPDGHPADDGFAWPIYGFTKARTHHLPSGADLRPPYRQAWAVRGRVLLEFTPVLCGRMLYLLKNNGALYAISRATGKVRWKRKLGALAASSPACKGDSVYSVLLERGRNVRGGRVVSVDAATGRTRWSRKLPSRAESSPLLDRGRLYFGTEDGTVYALRAEDGAVRWRTKAAGAVKGALALADGKLYFGDYGGRVHAVRRADGAKVWESSTSGSRLGLSSGNFYSSPAVAYGRVYIGNTDGFVYSFSSDDGDLAWRKRTGGFVYASPAVAQVPGGEPTVYIGSYDGRFYALNARTGDERWSRTLGGRISGAATVIGDLVWVSDLGRKSSWALGARTGQTVYKTRRGSFNPAISDGRRIYFNGYSSLFALDPAGGGFDRESAQRVAQRDRDRQQAAEQRAERRERDRRRAQEQRSRRFRVDAHGHRHGDRGPRACHPHRHVYTVRGERRVLKHTHCHTHLRRGR